MQSKTIEVKAHGLEDKPITIMLTFEQPGQDLFVKQFPIAWKVATLGAKANPKFRATWTENLGFATTEIHNGNLVTAGNYTPIAAGNYTTLCLEPQPTGIPYYYFTDSKPLAGGSNMIQCINGVNMKTPISVGFITNPGSDLEDFSPAITYPAVGAGMSVMAEFKPILKMYISLDYQQTQMLKAEIRDELPLWQGDMLSLGALTTLVIKRSPTGQYTATPITANYADDFETPMWKGIDTGLFDGKRHFEATLSFSNEHSVARGINAIARQLITVGYSVRAATKTGDNEAKLALSLPFGASCNQAQKALLSIVESPAFPADAKIAALGGELQVFTSASFSFWTQINPATPAWHFGGKLYGKAPFQSVHPTAIEEAVKGMGSLLMATSTETKTVISTEFLATNGAETNGNGYAASANGASTNATASPLMLAADVPPTSPTPIGFGKTRSVGRKPSAAYLAAAMAAA